MSLVIPFSEAARIPYGRGAWDGASHWFNHLLFSTDGARFSFLHRWGVRRPDGSVPFTTRLFTARPDGSDLYALDPNGKTSHYIWRDARHILAWAWHPSHGEKFYLYEDKSERVEVVGPEVMTVNGHCTYLPGNRWILNDTYPDKQRNQNPYLYNAAIGNARPAGALSAAHGVCGGVALRYASALLAGRDKGDDRWGAHGSGEADFPDRCKGAGVETLRLREGYRRAKYLA